MLGLVEDLSLQHHLGMIKYFIHMSKRKNLTVRKKRDGLLVLQKPF